MIALRGAVGCAAADVEVKAWFPDSPSLEFVVGQPMTAVIGVRNNGAEGFNLTAVQGNLALVTDPSGNVFNFTGTVCSMSQSCLIHDWYSSLCDDCRHTSIQRWELTRRWWFSISCLCHRISHLVIFIWAWKFSLRVRILWWNRRSMRCVGVILIVEAWELSKMRLIVADHQLCWRVQVDWLWAPWAVRYFHRNRCSYWYACFLECECEMKSKSSMNVHVPAVYSVYSNAVGQGWVKKPKPAKKIGTFIFCFNRVMFFFSIAWWLFSAEVRTSDKSEWLRGTIADKNKSSKQN